MSKKLINSPDSCVEDLIHGLLYANPMLTQVHGCNALVHSSIEKIREEQVTLISGNERRFLFNPLEASTASSLFT